MEAAQLLEKVTPISVPPFLLDEQVYGSLAESPPLEHLPTRPLPSWTFARKRQNGTKLPQTIAHRGLSLMQPENTMGAFKAAVEVGADAVETDIHLTKDDAVVLSHDASLKRCFGRDEKIINCTWNEISGLQTLKTPHQPMPRLRDLLEYLAAPGRENIWALLDIKLDNDARNVIRLIAETIKTVPPNPKSPWDRRLVMGCWAAKYLPLCAEYLPTFPITHIGFSTTYARQFLSVPNVSFNMLQQTLLVPIVGARFLRDAHAKGRPVYTWTVNDKEKMKWCIKKELDGVITDDPEKFKQVCHDWEHGSGERHRDVKITYRSWAMVAWVHCMVMMFGTIFWWRYGRLDRSQTEGGQPEVQTLAQPEGYFDLPINNTTTKKNNQYKEVGGTTRKKGVKKKKSKTQAMLR